jgi:hypothetical protein
MVRETSTPTTTPERIDTHNPSIDADRAGEGACARVHLPSGAVCTLPRGHVESCEFVQP